jgi:hypothetical protein
MRHFGIASGVVLAVVLAFSATVAQPGQESGSAKSAQSFNPRDLTGIWNAAPKMQPKDEPPVTFGVGIKEGQPLPPFTPLGKTIYDANVKANAAGFVLACNPLGVSRDFFTPRPFEVVQAKDRILQHYEYYSDWREVFTDGRSFPPDAEPDFMGYSIGHWEGNTFVVQAQGFNGKTWLGWGGVPMSDQMHQTERWQRIDADTLKIVFTFTDPKIYAKPWTVTGFWKLHKDWVMDAHPCTLDEIKEWDNKMGHPDGIPGLDYKASKN